MTPRALSLASLLALAISAPQWAAAQCPLPDPTQSFYVPQSGPVATPTEGASAYRFFRGCPNNDGGASFPNSARIKVVLRDATGTPLVGVPANQIYMLFNGGTPAQGFTGPGADSIISNSTWNVSPLCPDVRDVSADAPTDASGTTYITFTGGDPVNPGTGLRDKFRKWGHWDEEIPVYVGLPPCNPIRLKGETVTGAPLGSYALRIKNMDAVGGLGAILNQGEVVSILDFNVCTACLSSPGGFYCYWCDLDWTGADTSTDLNILTAHLTHDCDTPFSP